MPALGGMAGCRPAPVAEPADLKAHREAKAAAPWAAREVATDLRAHGAPSRQGRGATLQLLLMEPAAAAAMLTAHSPPDAASPPASGCRSNAADGRAVAEPPEGQGPTAAWQARSARPSQASPAALTLPHLARGRNPPQAADQRLFPPRRSVAPHSDAPQSPASHVSARARERQPGCRPRLPCQALYRRPPISLPAGTAQQARALAPGPRKGTTAAELACPPRAARP